MKKIVLASGNKGKITEIKTLFSGMPIELISQAEFNVPDAEEVGITFIENAIIKARNAAAHTGLPAIADDSGLTINALNGEPGVYSARYADTNEKRIAKVLKNLEGIGVENRGASFHCAIVLMRHENDPAPIVAHGIWPGEILFEARGDKGFGYDPIFFISDYKKSAAELEPELKNKISHRGRAFNTFLQELKHEMALAPL